MENKQMTLEAAAAIVKDGMLLGLGGNTLHRAPMGFVRQLVRVGVKDLRLIKTAGAHEIDLLCLADRVSSVDAGFVSYETQYGLAYHYRKAVEQGRVKANEHACYTVICALRAAASGAPYMPVRGLVVSDLLRVNPNFAVVDDPFGTGPVAVVRSIRPDVAVLHVHRCDTFGNAIIDGPRFEDQLLANAAKQVIVTTETILPAGSPEITPEKVHIPGFLVTAVVHLPGGAKPTSCYGKYSVDDAILRRFTSKDADLMVYMSAYQSADQRGGNFRG